jgi:amidohydrolase
VTDRVSTLVPSSLIATLFELRRDLHRHPELAFAERRTADVLERALAAIPGVTVGRVSETGLVARVPGRSPDAPVAAIRGDMDALPITEETGVPWASETPGVMHACGHDVHASWAVGAAHLLAAHPAAGSVVILLQPAEEVGRGALAMLEAGALDAVSAIVGGHVDVRFPVGTVVATAGPMAGSTDEFVIELVGAGGHAARPHEARDPIVAAAHVITALQTVVSRRVAPGDPAVVTVGTVQAGTASNVIPARALLTGTLRAVRPETRAILLEALVATAETTARAHRVEARVTIHPGTPPIVNSEPAAQWAQDAVRALLGADALVTLPEPNLGGEDFAFYLDRLPGCFVRIGARPPGGCAVPAHTSGFLPDERAILVGAAVLAETARRASEALTP